MEWIQGKAKLRQVETKILASIREISLSGYAPSFRGILYFLKGEDASSLFEGCSMQGTYASMSPKRLGKLLKNLQDYGYVDVAEEEAGESYYYLFPKGKEAADAWLAKDHVRSTPKKRGAPLYLKIHR